MFTGETTFRCAAYASIRPYGEREYYGILVVTPQGVSWTREGGIVGKGLDLVSGVDSDLRTVTHTDRTVVLLSLGWINATKWLILDGDSTRGDGCRVVVGLQVPKRGKILAALTAAGFRVTERRTTREGFLEALAGRQF